MLCWNLWHSSHQMEAHVGFHLQQNCVQSAFHQFFKTAILNFRKLWEIHIFFPCGTYKATKILKTLLLFFFFFLSFSWKTSAIFVPTELRCGMAQRSRIFPRDWTRFVAHMCRHVCKGQDFALWLAFFPRMWGFPASIWLKHGEG